MPKLVGALRVKNEELFLERTIEQACSYIDELAILDDFSTDKTIEIISRICYKCSTPYRIIYSPDKRYHEGRDRDLLLNLVHEMNADWCIQIDADEVYERNFADSVKKYMSMNIDVVWIGVCQMWSVDEKPWYDVTTFRTNNGWSTSFYHDGIGIQHNRPALFRIYESQRKSGSARDHGYLCPIELHDSNKCLYPLQIFAHFGYATPSLIKKKCERHGNIPPVTKEELEGTDYGLDYNPENWNPTEAIKAFEKEWLQVDNVDLKELNRKIWL